MSIVERQVVDFASFCNFYFRIPVGQRYFFLTVHTTLNENKQSYGMNTEEVTRIHPKTDCGLLGTIASDHF